MTARKGKSGGAGKSAPSFELPKTKTLGASGFTIHIYEAAVRAGEKGITVKELNKHLHQILGVTADTLRWGIETGRIKDSGLTDRDAILKCGEERVKIRVGHLRSDGVLKSLGHGRRTEARYTAGNPPSGYTRKWVTRPDWGYHPVDLVAEKVATQSHVREMQWLDRARKELAKPRSIKLRELVEDAVEIWGRKN